MPNGIEIFDKNGKRIFDGTSRVPKYLGIINAGVGSGSFTVTTSSDSAGIWIYPFNADGWSANNRGLPAMIWISNKTINWVNNHAYKIPVNIIYGEY